MSTGTKADGNLIVEQIRMPLTKKQASSEEFGTDGSEYRIHKRPSWIIANCRTARKE